MLNMADLGTVEARRKQSVVLDDNGVWCFTAIGNVNRHGFPSIIRFVNVDVVAVGEDDIDLDPNPKSCVFICQECRFEQTSLIKFLFFLTFYKSKKKYRTTQ